MVRIVMIVLGPMDIVGTVTVDVMRVMNLVQRIAQPLQIPVVMVLVKEMKILTIVQKIARHVEMVFVMGMKPLIAVLTIVGNQDSEVITGRQAAVQ
jgi:hypothetical protein